MPDGVIYVAYGQNAVRAATESIQSLRRRYSWPIAVIGDEVPGVQRIRFDPSMGGSGQAGMPARHSKVNLLHLSLFDRTLYLDADTQILSPGLDAGFKILADGWDLVMVPSLVQSPPLHSLDEEERLVTLSEIGDSLMLNTGVIWFQRTEAMQRLFAAWQEEWLRFKRHDQGALLRAMRKNPVKLWLLGSPFNGGEIVEHLFGRAR